MQLAFPFLFPSSQASPSSTLPFYATNGEKRFFRLLASAEFKNPLLSNQQKHVRNSEYIPNGQALKKLGCLIFLQREGGSPRGVSFFFCRLLTVLPVTARGDFASAVLASEKQGEGKTTSGSSLLFCFCFPFFPSGRVTAGIACGNKLKRDGWRVVLPLLGGSIRPHHSIPIILWTVTLQPFFLFQVSFCPMPTPSPPFFSFFSRWRKDTANVVMPSWVPRGLEVILVVVLEEKGGVWIWGGGVGRVYTRKWETDIGRCQLVLPVTNQSIGCPNIVIQPPVFPPSRIQYQRCAFQCYVASCPTASSSA